MKTNDGRFDKYWMFYLYIVDWIIIVFCFFRASENTTSASGGRLNNPNSAWCFHYDHFIGQKAYFLVDLGSVQLISGFLSQGPPQSLHPKEYLRYVGLEIEYSSDGIKWGKCCDEERKTVYTYIMYNNSYYFIKKNIWHHLLLLLILFL